MLIKTVVSFAGSAGFRAFLNSGPLEKTWSFCKEKNNITYTNIWYVLKSWK